MSLAALVWPEGVVALVIGLGGGTALLNSTTAPERIAIVGDSLSLLGVLLGIVFAAFALLIALFSEEYIRLLGKAEGGIMAFLRPFVVAIGWQVTTMFISIGYRAAATDLDSRAEVGVFLAWAFLFTFALADVVALTRNVTMHGLYRAQMANPEDNGNVRALPDRANES